MPMLTDKRIEVELAQLISKGDIRCSSFNFILVCDSVFPLLFSIFPMLYVGSHYYQN